MSTGRLREVENKGNISSSKSTRGRLQAIL